MAFGSLFIIPPLLQRSRRKFFDAMPVPDEIKTPFEIVSFICRIILQRSVILKAKCK